MEKLKNGDEKPCYKCRWSNRFNNDDEFEDCMQRRLKRNEFAFACTDKLWPDFKPTLAVFPHDEYAKRNKIRFSDLTEKQRNFICNGCGAKGYIKAPEFLEFACCDHHDFNYWLGYREEDRKKADKQFHDAMMVDVFDQPFYLVTPRYLQAKLFYMLVRIGGSKAFHYGAYEKNLIDLNMEMKRKKA